MIYKMDLKDSSDTMTFNLLETPIVDKDIEGAVDNVTLDGNQYTDYLYLKKQYIQKWAIMCPDEYDELRGFYTRQFEEGEVPSYRVYYGANVTRDYTLNGDYFQFNAEGIETGMTLSQLLGNAEQTTYSGKNLVDFAGNTLASHNGLTITSSFDGTIKWTGTPSANWANITSIIAVSLPAGTYTFSTTTTSNHRIYVHLTPSYDFVIEPSHTSVTHTFTSAITAIQLDLSGLSTSTNYNESVKLMLESGSTATAYEPYVGGTPAPNPSYPQPISTVTGEQTVKITGKNLVEDTISGSSIDGNGIIRSNPDFDTQVAFVIAGETYTLSYTGGTVVGGYFATKPTMNSVSIDGTRIVNNNKTFVAQYTGYFVFRTNAGESSAQCELGNQATAYEPYQGQSCTIDLGSLEFVKVGNYRDKIWNDNGTWKIHKEVGKVTLPNTVGSYNGVSNWYYMDFANLGIGAGVQDGGVISNYFTMDGYDHMGANATENGAIATSATYIVIRNTACTDAESYRAWLGSNPTTVYYALATPTDTEITDETLLSQLNFLASLYEGENNISLVGTGAQGEMEVFIRDVMSVETDVVPEVPVRLTLTDDGVINACGCRRNVQLTMRETTE